MVGHITPPVHPVDGNPFFFELSFTPQQILLVPAPPERVHMRVLEQQQGGWAIPLCNFTRVFLLQLPGALILNQPQVKDFNHHFLLVSSHLAWFSSPSYAAYWYESDRVG